MSVAPTGRAPKPALPPRRFEFYTGALRAVPDAADRVLRATASSTVVDHYGTRFSETAQEDMERSALADGGMTVFRDHEHGANDSIGSVIGARRTKTDDVTDLEFEIRLLPEGVDEDVDKLWRRIQSGIRLGLSVGAEVLEAKPIKAVWRGAERNVVEFAHVLLHEASVVGIPGNPRSWVHYALRSLATEGDMTTMPEIRELLGLPDTDILDVLRAEESGRDAASKAQAARAKQYGIGVKEGGNVTKPGDMADVPDAEWADPVNYRYPMHDKAHADNAASRWGDADNRAQYDAAEQAIIAKRIEAAQARFGESGDDKDEGKKRTAPDGEERAITFTHRKRMRAIHDHAARALHMDCAPQSPDDYDGDGIDDDKDSSDESRALTHSHRDRMQRIHDESARALNMDCAPDSTDAESEEDEGAADEGVQRAYKPKAYHADPDETVECPDCKKMNDVDASYCDQCGYTLEGAKVQVGGKTVAGFRPQPYHRDPDENVICPKCERANDNDARYCDQCGFKLEGAQGVVIDTSDGDAGDARHGGESDDMPTRSLDLDDRIREARDILRQLDAARSVRDETITALTDLTARRVALEDEVGTLEAKRAALLSQSTGRPTQRDGESVFAVLEGRDLLAMSDDEILGSLKTNWEHVPPSRR